MCSVSIILPSYNHLAFLESRINSILEQSYRDFELIILDDYSTDGSWEFLKKFIDHEKVTFCFKNDKNSKTPFGLWKKGFDLARGELIWIAESDDLVSSEFLEIMVAKFQNTDVVLSHCRSLEFNFYPNDGFINNWWSDLNSELWENDFIQDGRFLLENFGRFKCPVVNVSSAVFRKSTLNKVVLPIDFRYCGDWFFWIQIYLLGNVAYCARPLNYFRIHDLSATSEKNSNEWIKIIENTKIAKFASKALGLKFQYRNEFQWLLLRWKIMVKKDRFLGFYYCLKYLPLTFIFRILKPL